MNTYDTLKMKSFPVVVDSDCETINRIYPLKQRIVDELHKKAEDFDIVRKIYIREFCDAEV